jgi:hypothetical protein
MRPPVTQRGLQAGGPARQAGVASVYPSMSATSASRPYSPLIKECLDLTVNVKRSRCTHAPILRGSQGHARGRQVRPAPDGQRPGPRSARSKAEGFQVQPARGYRAVPGCVTKPAGGQLSGR